MTIFCNFQFIIISKRTFSQWQMQEFTSSPKTLFLQKSQMLSSPNLHKQKSYLPSRYLPDRNHNKNGLHEVLSSIQSNLKTAEIQKITTSNTKANLTSPSKLKLKIKQPVKLQEPKINGQTMDFRAKPLKREENDLLNFKQIFIEPRQEVLTKIQEEGKKNTSTISKIMSKEYEKLLQFENGHTQLSPNKNVTSSLQFSNDEQLKDSEIPLHFQECIQILDQNQSEKPNSQNFYEEHIRIQPPDLPNSSIASTLTPGSGYAPSVPMNAGTITKQSNLKQLLMRAKAGMNTQDIQKQAHLSYFLGAVYEQKGQYNSALKFYRRFLSFARTMEDKIGMALGANRVAINYFNNGDIQKSISFHNENLKLSDNENCFSGFYNLGICYRRLKQYDESLEHFETSLEWANQRGQLDSQCLSYGQLAMTYQKMQLYQQSLQHFQKSLDICNQLKKTKLQLFNLRNILRITSHFKLRSSRNLLEIAQQAYECAKSLQDKKMVEIFSCNIGIIKGLDQFNDRKNTCINQTNNDVVYLDEDL